MDKTTNEAVLLVEGLVVRLMIWRILSGLTTQKKYPVNEEDIVRIREKELC